MFWANLFVAAYVIAGSAIAIEDMNRLDSLRRAGCPRPLWQSYIPVRPAPGAKSTSHELNGSVFGDFVCNDDVAGGCSQRSAVVAASAQGGFVVVWCDFRDGDADIWYQRFDASGSPVGANERVNADLSLGWQGDPSAAMARSGGFLFAWEDRRNIGNSDLFCQRFDPAGGRRGDNFRVSDSSAAGDQCMSGAQTGPDGTTLIAWDDRRHGITGDIYAQFVDSAGGFRGDNFRVNDDAIGRANQYEPAVSGDDSGRFVVVWMDGRGNNASDWNIFAQRFRSDGTRIGSNMQVTTDDSIQWAPSVGACPDGRFAIAWDDRRRNQWDVYAQFYGRNGQALGGNFRVNGDAGAADQAGSSIAGNEYNEFMIVWSDRRNGHSDVFGQIFDSTGNRLGPELRLNDDVGITDQSGPSIASLPGGGYVVVWCDGRNGDADVYCQRVSREGAKLGTNFRVNDDQASSHQRVSSIGMDRSGVVCVGWEDERSGETDVYRVMMDAAGRRLGPNLRLNDDAGSASQFYTAVAGGSGRFLAVWTDARDGYDIYGQFMDGSGDPVGANFRVNSDTGAFQWYPYVAMDSSNRAMVVWMDTRDGSGFALYCRRFNGDGTPAGPEFRVGDVVSEQAYASVAMSTSGRAVTAWMDNREGGRHQIYCQLFGTDGAPVGPNFRVNTDSGNAYHGYPACAITDDGQFVVAWEDTRNGTYDVYMQWFDSTGSPLDTNVRVNDNPGGSTDCYSPTCAFDRTGRLAIAFNDEREFPGNPQLLCQRFRPDRSRMGSNQRVNEPNQFPNNHHWTVGQSIAVSSEVLAFAWTDNRRHRGWDIFARVADWNLADVEDVGCGPTRPEGIWPTVVVRSRSTRLFFPVEGELRLLDACGRVVWRARRSAGVATVDLNCLSPGVYYFSLRPAGGINGKLVIR